MQLFARLMPHRTETFSGPPTARRARIVANTCSQISMRPALAFADLGRPTADPNRARSPNTQSGREEISSQEGGRSGGKGVAVLRVPSRSHWARRRGGRTLRPAARARRCRVRRGRRPTPTAPCRRCGQVGRGEWHDARGSPVRGAGAE
jgi:hypothetical protein